MTTTEALGAWGAYDRDDPFPLFAAVRELGPVHPVTLADGHDAWLVVGYEEARIALNDPRLSKDMHAALATGGGVVAEGLPGPVVRPAHAQRRPARSQPTAPPRLVRLHAAPRRGAPPAGAGDRGRPPRRDRRRRTRRAGRSRRRVRVPAAVHRHLRAARRARAGSGRPGARAHRAARPHLDPRRVRAGEGGVRRGRRDARGARRRQAGQPRRRPRERAHQRPRRRRAAQHPGAAVDDLPADRGRPRHDGEPHRQRRRRPAPASGAARRAAVRSRQARRRRRGAPPLRRTRSPLDLPLRRRTDGHR